MFNHQADKKVSPIGEDTLTHGLLLVLLLGVIGWFILRFTTQTIPDFREFGDETEKIVVATMIRDGKRLYKDIFANHGPLTFIFAHLIQVITGTVDGRVYRLFQGLLTLGTAVAIGFSPLLVTWRQRILTIIFFLLLMGKLAIQYWWGYMLLFQAIAGLLFLLSLAGLILPVALDRPVPKLTAIFSGIAFSWVGFCGYSYSLSLFFAVVFVGLAALICPPDRYQEFKRTIYWGLLGIGIGCSFVALWLLLYGDFKGYFVYHFYFNQVIYSKFINFNFFAPLLSPLEIFSEILSQNKAWVLKKGGYILALLAMMTSVIFLIPEWNRIAKPHLSRSNRQIIISLLTIVLSLTLLYLNPRGDDNFQLGAFATCSFGLWSMMINYVTLPNSLSPVFSKRLFSILLVIAIMTIGIFISHNTVKISTEQGFKTNEKIPSQLTRKDNQTFDLIRQIVPESETVESLPFRPAFYIYADRRPASADIFYLPMQAKYEQNPIMGSAIDLCTDLKTVQPKVIYFDNMKIWGQYEFSDYAPCVYNLIKENYLPLSQRQNVYILKKVIEQRPDLPIKVLENSPL